MSTHTAQQREKVSVLSLFTSAKSFQPESGLYFGLFWFFFSGSHYKPRGELKKPNLPPCSSLRASPCSPRRSSSLPPPIPGRAGECTLLRRQLPHTQLLPSTRTCWDNWDNNRKPSHTDPALTLTPTTGARGKRPKAKRLSWFKL